MLIKIILKRSVILLLFIMVTINLISCGESNNNNNNNLNECQHLNTSWKWDKEISCGQTGYKSCYCDDCGEYLNTIEEKKEHDLVTTVIPQTCTTEGYTSVTCKNCYYETTSDKLPKLGHDLISVLERDATNELYGIKYVACSRCDLKESVIEFVNNDFSTHGALHVDGIDLMDKNNEKFRLAGISTFGLQWQPEYVNEVTFENLKNEFGINVIRLAMYTGEGGYCSGTEKMKQQMYDTVVKGINIATDLNMYVIVDWHMLGVDEGDNNPLYYLKESKEFFNKITNEFKDHDNILFEIMNEPCYVTWQDCKTYAEEVIPVIRNNMKDAIILVGNPQWSSDLASVAKDPLVGYDNIMYTFHFYANDNCHTDKIIQACEKDHLPVFITEHGGMDASGYGDLNFESLTSWYNVLDKYNISFIAWSLSNLNSSSCMFKTGSPKIDDVSDSNLKTWGIYYKFRVRKVMGLPIGSENK